MRHDARMIAARNWLRHLRLRGCLALRTPPWAGHSGGGGLAHLDGDSAYLAWRARCSGG